MLAPIEAIFCDIDDFCKEFFDSQQCYLLPNPNRIRHRGCQMSLSELATILVLFQMSHYRSLKDFYQECIHGVLKSYFPSAVSYNRFVELESSCLSLLSAYLLSKTGERTQLYYMDSTTLTVCHNKRIRRNKVFKGIAQRGKSAMGWFYGFKLHIAINHQGELVSFCVTKGNVDDRKQVLHLMRDFKGIVCADKGYVSKKLTQTLAEQGITLVTKVRKNMKKKIYSAFETFLLSKRGIIETIIDQLKNWYHLEHTRHRSPINFLVNIVSALAAYTWQDNKPKVYGISTVTHFKTVTSN